MDQQYSEEESFTGKLKSHFLDLIEFVAIVGVIVLVVHYFIAEPHQVSGSSMVPNFHEGDYIITNKLTTKFSTIKRYQVIIFKSPREPSKVFIKRVIGLPDERVKIADGHVFVNSFLLTEHYLPPTTLTSGGAFLSNNEEVVVPQDQYFVMGDNRGGSSDSREWGPVRKELVIGEAWLRYWPVPKFGLIKQG